MKFALFLTLIVLVVLGLVGGALYRDGQARKAGKFDSPIHLKIKNEKIEVIDGCEYYVWEDHFGDVQKCHKGNCKFCEAKRLFELNMVLDQIKKGQK